MRPLFFILFVGVLFPTLRCDAAIRFNEVAWMGVAGANGQFGEWIELYNDGSSPVDLSGWKMYDNGGGTLVFTLTKTIGAGGYLLIERTTASMTDPVAGIDDEHGTFGGGGFSNDGEDVVLKDASGAVVHALSYATGWPAGDAATKETMQWNGTAWITAPATPKAATATIGDDGDEEETTDDEPDETNDSEETDDGGGSSAAKKTYKPKLTLDLSSDLYQYVEYTLTADVVLEDGLHHRSGLTKWNLGDGTALSQRTLEPVRHAYRYPGTYTVWIGYYKHSYDPLPTLELTRVVRVGSPAVEVAVIDREAVELTNRSSASVDLSLWQIISGGQRATLPERTLLAPDASVVFSAATLGFSAIGEASLARPSGEPLSITRVLGSTRADAANTAPTQSSEEVFDDESTVIEEASATGTKRNRTKKFIFGAAALTVLALCLLLERFMAKRE